jgi:hypothetical protein
MSSALRVVVVEVIYRAKGGQGNDGEALGALIRRCLSSLD